MTIGMSGGICRSADSRSSGLTSIAFIHFTSRLADVPIDVIYRNPGVAAAFHRNVADAGERQVSSGNQTAFGCQRCELPLSLRGRRGGIHVIDDRDPRLGE